MEKIGPHFTGGGGLVKRSIICLSEIIFGRKKERSLIKSRVVGYVQKFSSTLVFGLL